MISLENTKRCDDKLYPYFGCVLLVLGAFLLFILVDSAFITVAVMSYCCYCCWMGRMIYKETTPITIDEVVNHINEMSGRKPELGWIV